MAPSCLPLSQSESIAQIASPQVTEHTIPPHLCDRCDKSIHSRLSSTEFDRILELSRSESGYNPSASERETYVGMLDEVRYEIEHRQSELRHLRDVTQELEEHWDQQRLLKAYEAGIRNILSPIHSLPLEILGLIFQYVCCGKGATDVANYYFHPSTGTSHRLERLPTFDVRRVCIRWYRIVTSMPVLWTSFGINGCDPKSQSLVRTFLERSRSNLIDFRLSDTSAGIKFPPSPLITHCNRWRHVSIAGTFLFLLISFLAPLIECGETPSNLISLELKCFTLSSHAFTFPIVRLPSIKSLVLSGLALDFETPQYAMTTLCLSKVNRNDVLSLLSLLPNIKSLQVDSIMQDNSPASARAIVLKKMQNLTLKSPIDDDFLISVRCPHLASLSLCNSHPGFEDVRFESMISLLNQSEATLTHLTLKNMLIHCGELLQLFRLATVGGILELLAAPRRIDQEKVSDPALDRDVDDESRDDSEDLESRQTAPGRPRMDQTKKISRWNVILGIGMISRSLYSHSWSSSVYALSHAMICSLTLCARGDRYSRTVLSIPPTAPASCKHYMYAIPMIIFRVKGGWFVNSWRPSRQASSHTRRVGWTLKSKFQFYFDFTVRCSISQATYHESVNITSEGESTHCILCTTYSFGTSSSEFKKKKRTS
ncbi:hypothetical protein EV361DRAFT_299859 [Lentinula raphanica]|nr:hypothetical protein EV361DRAFT_299859 [Lentinula raphanica]